MADNGKSQQTVIKKYANRRLYHTGTSTYVTLEDLSTMVQNGEDFLVYDARSGDDITRSVLTQIIFEQENKAGDDNLLPVAFLRQLIRFYGDSMRTMVPSFLEFSMANFARDQDGLREKMNQSFAPKVFQSAMEEQVRANMSFFGDAMKMFTTFGTGPLSGMKSSASAPTPSQPATPVAAPDSDLDELKRQMAEMRNRLEDLAKK
ncbi:MULTISPECIES: polyhydroxyalkanoate synthesis repressor PhaR [unclassified Methylobacterium]|uniref:polyhydroxyalkanoate synthesis repressor PhaR n=1 Tax=unclassified Methylobacterium TaxID=2615210 RepID=UPI0007004212|nr:MULTISPECIES: polyhydroxyalkanoate synthesis repressor PhaR [unclassified Methylobacterium]KQP16978.1 polyhydroxyalkanoate synthesis repressor [Methylobacterium sp. Leaf93]KQP47445.1 polyhydroxyalkanoate synthesis repressor [Methylobacterium sp. Leaf106]